MGDKKHERSVLFRHPPFKPGAGACHLVKATARKMS